MPPENAESDAFQDLDRSPSCAQLKDKQTTKMAAPDEDFEPDTQKHTVEDEEELDDDSLESEASSEMEDNAGNNIQPDGVPASIAQTTEQEDDDAIIAAVKRDPRFAAHTARRRYRFGRIMEVQTAMSAWNKQEIVDMSENAVPPDYEQEARHEFQECTRGNYIQVEKRSRNDDGSYTTKTVQRRMTPKQLLKANEASADVPCHCFRCVRDYPPSDRTESQSGTKREPSKYGGGQELGDEDGDGEQLGEEGEKMGNAEGEELGSGQA